MQMMQWTGNNFCDIKLFCPHAVHIYGDDTQLGIDTPERVLLVRAGDYIEKQPDGTFVPRRRVTDGS